MTVPLTSRITPTPACEPASLAPIAATPVVDDLFAALMEKTSDEEKPIDAATPSQDDIVEASGADDVRLMWPLLAVAVITPQPTTPQPGVSVAKPPAGGARSVRMDAGAPEAVKSDARPARDMDVQPGGAEPGVLISGAVVVGATTHRPPPSLSAHKPGASPALSDEAEGTLTVTMPDKDNDGPGDKAELPSVGREIEGAKAGLAEALIERDTALGTSPGSVATQIASSLREALSPSDNAQARAAPGADAEPAWYKAQLRILDVVLKPEHLGRIEIKMKLAGDGLSVMLTPQTETARHLLEGQLGGLKDSLTAAGYDLSNIGIERALLHNPFGESRRDPGATPGVPRDSAGAETSQGNGRHDGRNAGHGRQDQSAARHNNEPEQKPVRQKPGVYV
ncbi:MAG: flagellar hook-length control protein FliK [Hyphomicrobium sp.]|jgi:hypothetical protein|nr:flagellar hook-length control protein FliK [Hyphomicrobium sp.]